MTKQEQPKTIGRRRKTWQALVENEDGSTTTIKGRYAGSMDMAKAVAAVPDGANIQMEMATIQKHVYQYCITSPLMYATPDDTHELTGKPYDPQDPNHMLISELEIEAQGELMLTMAPWMRPRPGPKGGKSPEQEEGEATAEKFPAGRSDPDNADS